MSALSAKAHGFWHGPVNAETPGREGPGLPLSVDEPVTRR